MNNNENEQKNLLILVICVIANVISFIFTRGIQGLEFLLPYSGVFAQIGIISSVIAILTNKKRGFVTMVVMWCITSIPPLIGLIATGNIKMLPSIGLFILAIVIDYVIYSNIAQSDAMHKQLNIQNKNLMESNKLMEEKDESLRILAYKDQMTGMNNKAYFSEQMDEAIQKNQPFTVIYSDMDNFKGVNDTFGPEVGDAALLTYAERVSAFCGTKYLSARTSGDDFALLLTGEHSESELTNTIEQLRRALNAPMNIHGKAFAVTSSYGVVSYPNGGENSASLLKNAIVSVYRAKAGGKDKACFYGQS
ncbi:MAG: GGDEF domain-containing protein [Oscillospiraceae bacterium]|nr:GGDEF domain-containing protein [Oscillospiraceae bacterium]